MSGDATNFTHWDEVALSWSFVDNISQVWEDTDSLIFLIMNLEQWDRKKAIFYLQEMASSGGQFPI